jgi:hypothetical protein
MGGYLYLYNCMSAFVFLDLRNGLTSNEEGGGFDRNFLWCSSFHLHSI